MKKLLSVFRLVSKGKPVYDTSVPRGTSNQQIAMVQAYNVGQDLQDLYRY